MEKINVAEILKDCPPGTKLDCTMYEGVTLKNVSVYKDDDYPICIETKNGFSTKLTKYGQNVCIDDAKCVIFPPGQTTWKGFVPPCKFKGGDIISDSLGTCIFRGEGVVQGTVDFYCSVHGDYFTVKQKTNGHYGNIVDYRLATEEKEILFDAIKENGYHWDAERKTLEKLIEPKFKVGDRVVIKGGISVPVLITKVGDEFYYSNTENSAGFFMIKDQDDWELVPNKFDISTLEPFESKVLVRNSDYEKWRAAFWGYLTNDMCGFNYDTTRGNYKQCIPYEGNEHLLGKNKDCDEFYKTWEL